MSRTHHAYVQNTPAGSLELQHVVTPVPSSGQALISVLATPILSYTGAVLDGSLGFPLSHPLTPGVSAIGRIDSTGPDSANLQPGQLVFCNPTIVARDNVVGGIAILHGWFGGMTPQTNQLMEKGWRNGAWSKKMIVPLENVVPLEEGRLIKELGYTVPELCWINELLIPFGGWLAAGLSAGATAIVAPATGNFGACAVRVALAMGAGSVVALGRNENILTRVVEMNSSGVGVEPGCVKSVLLSGDIEADAQKIRAATPAGSGADVYLDFSPFQASGATYPQASVAALKNGGHAVLMGGVRSDISFNYALLMSSNITVRGNFMYPSSAPLKLLGLLQSGLLNLKGLNTEVFDFENIEDSIAHAKNHGGIADLTVLAPAKE